MRLIKCRVENFGRLHDLDVSFRPGMNVLLEENGWGKSTLAVFIRVMFYGFDNDKKRDVVVNERKHYLPWQNGVYGGSVTFEAGGGTYRLERTFGSTKAKDTRKLFDDSTNLPSGAFGDNIGEELFGIDGGSFQKTVYTGQQNCETSVTSEIGARIGRVSDDTADMGNFETVQANLNRELNRLTPDRKTGLINKLETEAAALREQAARKPVRQQNLDDLQSQRDSLQAELDDENAEQARISKELRRLSAVKDLQTDAAQYGNLMDEEQAAAGRLREALKPFGGKVPDDRFVREAAELEGECTAAGGKSYRIQQNRLQAEMLKMMADDAEEQEQAGRSRYLKFSLIMEIVFVVLGVVLLCRGRYAFGIILMLGGSAAAAYIYRTMKKRQEDADAFAEEAAEKKENYEILLKTIASDEAYVASVEKRTGEFMKAAGLTPEEDPEVQLRRILSQADTVRDLDAAYRMRKEKRLDFERAHDMDKIKSAAQTEPVSMEALAAQQEKIRYDINETGGRIRAVENMLHDAEAQLAETEDAERELAAREERIGSLRHRYDIISKTKHYLEQAKINFSAHYMDPIKRSFDKYYDMMSGGDEKQYELDADLNIALKEKGGTHDTGLLSEGYKDLVGLCRRMAMTDAMYEKEKPFLIFDDPFVNLDDEKLQGALQFLTAAAEDYQIIYFTCSRSRCPEPGER